MGVETEHPIEYLEVMQRVLDCIYIYGSKQISHDFVKKECEKPISELGTSYEYVLEDLHDYGYVEIYLGIYVRTTGKGNAFIRGGGFNVRIESIKDAKRTLQLTEESNEQDKKMLTATRDAVWWAKWAVIIGLVSFAFALYQYYVSPFLFPKK